MNNNVLYCFKIFFYEREIAFFEEILGSLNVDFSIEKELDLNSVYAVIYAKSEDDIKVKEEAIIKAIKELKEIHYSFSNIFKIEEKDWSEEWKKYFDIIHVDQDIVIKPSWKSYYPRKGEILIDIDPGLSFGTGGHETTQLSLLAIKRVYEDRMSSFIDTGMGSGILSILAAKLGFKEIYGIDNDKFSIEVVKKNLEKNYIENGVIDLHLQYCDIAEFKIEKKFDLVVANIISSVLIRNRDRIISLIKDNGYLVLSGILNREYLDIKQFFLEVGMISEVESMLGKEWCAIIFKKSL